MLADATPVDAIRGQVQATGNDLEALNTAATKAMTALVTGDRTKADAAREQAAQALVNAREEAQQQAAQMLRRQRAIVERLPAIDETKPSLGETDV
jgi:ElaB/YqjD/DUF883 family membrane-anchored ribosome-binding protein